MRAKFVVQIKPVGVEEYPTDEAFVKRLWNIGIGRLAGKAEEYEHLKKRYSEQAKEEWGHLPGVAEKEADQVIFFARYPDQCKLIVTRPQDNAATFRLIHDDFGELQEHAEVLIRQLSSHIGSLDGLTIDHDRVEIFERQQISVLMIGTVISSPVREVGRQHPAIAASILVTGVTGAVTLLALVLVDFQVASIPRELLEKFLTAMMASFFVALTSFFQYWRYFARHHTVEWRPAPSHVRPPPT